ncbi:MAG: DnaD domain protein [Eubacteriales bacterium]|nr:DnaD domain protein [Eubacteriales bacterium]
MGDKKKKYEENIILSLPFLAKYLPVVSGEDLKIYMAYEFLRTTEGKVSEEKIADLLETTEQRVKKSIVFWETEGVIVKDNVKIPMLEKEETVSFQSVVPQIMVFAEIYLGRNLNNREISILNGIEKTCHFDFSMFQYLFDYCINKKKKNFSYMEKVANSWKERGIQSVSEADSHIRNYSELISAISKTFGITNRLIGNSEKAYIDSWIEKNFSKELILEACRRTILHTGKGSFPYTDKILDNWYSNGVNNLKGVEKLDGPKKESVQEKKSKNQFHNFDERIDYDWDALEKALHSLK